MKGIIVIIACMTCCVRVHAQTDTGRNWFADSARVVQLSGVVVSSQLKNQHQQLASFFQKYGTGNLEDILSRLPEVTMIRRGSYGMEPGLRGLSGARVNVMVDGMRIHGACTDKMDPATIYIEPANLESIAMQTAGSGSLLGVSTGGAFNFQLQEPDFATGNIWKGSVHAGYHSASEGFTNSAVLHYQSQRFAMRATGTYRKHNTYKNGDGKTIPFSQYEKVNYSVSLKYKWQNGITMLADFIGDDGFNMGYPALPMDVGYAGARIAALTISAPARGRFQQTRLKVYGNSIKHNMDDTQRPDVPMHMDMPGYAKTVGFFAESTLRSGENDRISFRADGSSTHLKASMTMYPSGEAPMYMLTWPDNRRNQWGLSAQWKHYFSKKVLLDVKGRGEYVHSSLTGEESKRHVAIFNNNAADIKTITGNASIALNYKPTSSWQVFVTTGYGTRVGSASELYGFYLFGANDGYDYIGTIDLLPEKAINFELGGQYQRKNLRTKLTVFASQITDYITGLTDTTLSVMTPGAKGVKRYKNYDKATLLGGEASLMLQVMKKFHFVSTMKYTRGVFMNNVPLGSIAPYRQVTAINYHWKKIRIGAESEFSAAQHRYNVYEGEDATPGFHLMHLRLAYGLEWEKTILNLQTGIENVFNKNYHEHNDWGNIPRPGRNLYFQLGLSF